jgi:regulation of enolase protein 1 (concanavalin A-like superfamily)
MDKSELQSTGGRNDRKGNRMDALTIPALPAPCIWHNRPADWSLEGDAGLSISAGPKTDWFVDPGGEYAKDNAPAALFTPPDEHCVLSTRVRVRFAADFDAGTLQARLSDDLWGKLCFEYSPQKQPMIVSVVTRGFSDDCNSATIQGDTVHLRIARTPRALAFHYSIDGRYWNLVRYFTLGWMQGLRLGFSAQSPTGEACLAAFSDLNYRAGALQDTRDGS